MYMIYEARRDKLIPASTSLSTLPNYVYHYNNCLIGKTFINLKIKAKPKL